MEASFMWALVSSAVLSVLEPAAGGVMITPLDDTVSFWAVPENTAEPIDVNLTRLPVADAVRFLAGSDVNVFVDAAASRNLDLSVRGVSAGEALDLLLQQEGLSARFEGDAIFVSDRETRIYQLPLILDAESPQWQAIESGIGALKSLDGVLAIHKPAGIVSLQDHPASLDRCEVFLHRTMQSLLRQVEIEVKILEIVHDDDQGIGFDWSALDGVLSGNWNVVGNLAGGAVARQRTSFGKGIFEVGVLHADKWDAFFEAFDQRAHVNLISRPRITAMSNQRALFSVTERIPYFTKTVSQEGGVSTTQFALAFDEAGIDLDLTASIGDDGIITLKVRPVISSVVGFTASLPDLGPQPIIDTRETLSTVRLTSGNTLVLGGLMQDRTTENVTGIPVLSKIPFLGALFRSKETRKEQTEIAVLLTPRLRTDSATESLDLSDRVRRAQVSGSGEELADLVAASRCERAWSSTASGRTMNALEWAEGASRANPAGWWTLNNLALTQRAAGYVPQAVATMRLAVRAEEPAAAVALHNLGVLLLHRGEWNEAALSFEEAAKSSDVALRDEALLSWASAVANAGRTEEAIEILNARAGGAEGRLGARVAPRLARLMAERDRSAPTLARP